MWMISRPLLRFGIQDVEGMMNKISRYWLAPSTIFMLLTGCDKNPFENDISHGAIEICEKLLFENLKSPSSYKRISVEYIERLPFSYEEFQKYTIARYCLVSESLVPCAGINKAYVGFRAKGLGEERGLNNMSREQATEMRKLYWQQEYDRYREDKNQRRPALVSIEYDAENSFGTALRGLETCGFGPRRGEKYSTSDLYDVHASVGPE
jgi:hypothetical protein